MSSHIPIVDASPFFTGFVPFTANGIYPVHRWYRYKEGFSKDLVHFSLGLARRHVRRCLDPFAGSGTTGEVAFEMGRKAVLIESSSTCLKALDDRIRSLNGRLFYE